MQYTLYDIVTVCDEMNTGIGLRVVTITASDRVKDASLKAKSKDFKLSSRILEDEDLSSRTPTLVNIELNVLVKRHILYTFTQ